MKPEETIDFHIRWAWHRIARLYNMEAAKHGGSMAIGYALLSIDMEQGTPSTSLGPRMGMEPRSLTRTLKTMESNGLICRKPDKGDQRIVRIHLTKLGKQKRELAKQSVIRLNETVQSKIPNGKLSAFFDVMSQLSRILETELIFTNGKKNN